MHNIALIQNFYSYSQNLAAGGQPDVEQLKMLKQEGYEIIINISPVSAKNALHNEHPVIEDLYIDYIHFPVDCSNLRDFHYLTFQSLMKSAEGRKTFVHCGANIKSSNLLHMYNVLEKGIDEAESLKTLLKIQKPEDKWFAFFRHMGMKGFQN